MEKKILSYIVLSLLLLLGVSLFWNYKQYRDIKEKPYLISLILFSESALPRPKVIDGLGTLVNFLSDHNDATGLFLTGF